MKEKDFLEALQNTRATTNVLIDAVCHMAEFIDKCTPKTAGLLLNDAVAIAGLSQLLLIDVNNLTKVE